MMFLQQLVTQLSEWMSKGENFVPALFIALLIYILSRFVLEHFNRKATKREFRHKRVSDIGTVRFEKETFHLERLSSALLQLVTSTESLSYEDESSHCTWKKRNEWMSAYRESVKVLGAAAPFLNFIDLKYGVMECGVRDERYARELRDLGFAGCENLERHLTVLKVKSLYTRAALILDSCVYRARPIVSSSIGMVLGEQLDKSKEAPCSIKQELAIQYQQFLNCAYCRLKDCESSSKDARRQRFKTWLLKRITWFVPSIYHKFDRDCSYECSESSDFSGSPSSRLVIGCESDKYVCEELENAMSYSKKCEDRRTGITVVFVALILVWVLLKTLSYFVPFIANHIPEMMLMPWIPCAIVVIGIVCLCVNQLWKG